MPMIKLDGLDKAVIGVTSHDHGGNYVLVYSYYKLMDIFMADGMTEEEAADYIDYNILGLRIGDGAPLIMYDCDIEEAEDYYADI